MIYRQPWKTREAFELATLTWVSWFNNHRLMGPLGYIPPAEAEANYYREPKNMREEPKQRQTPTTSARLPPVDSALN